MTSITAEQQGDNRNVLQNFFFFFVTVNKSYILELNSTEAILIIILQPLPHYRAKRLMEKDSKWPSRLADLEGNVMFYCKVQRMRDRSFSLSTSLQSSEESAAAAHCARDRWPRDQRSITTSLPSRTSALSCRPARQLRLFTPFNSKTRKSRYVVVKIVEISLLFSKKKGHGNTASVCE